MKGVVIRAIVLAAGLLLASVVVIDWDALVWEGARRQTNDAQLRGDPTPLAARVAGYIATVAIGDYQWVHAGDLLYRIEDRDYLARVERARAELAEAQAAVGVAEAQLASQDTQVNAALAGAQSTDAQLQRARSELQRQTALLGTESGLRRAYEAAAADARRQAATLSGDRNAVAAARAQIQVLTAQLAQAHAAVQGRRAALDLARVEEGYTRITAPVDGVVGARLVRTGQYVAPGTMLITLVPLARVWAVASYREEQIAGMAAAQPATVRVDAFPGIVLRGRVDSFEPGSEASSALLPPDRAVGNFTKIVQRVPVKIVLDRTDISAHRLEGRLVPGLSVETIVDTAAAARPAEAP